MHTLEPQNKYVWLEPIGQSNKAGSLYIPDSAQRGSYRLAKVLGVAHDAEVKAKVGDTVLYDSLGEIVHKVDDKEQVLALARTIVTVIREVPVQRYVSVPDPTFEGTR